MYPAYKKITLNVFCIGLRNIDEHIGGREVQKASISFDISGDTNEPMYTDTMRIRDSGVNVNRILPLMLDVPNNQNFSPVMDVFAWENTDGEDKMMMATTSIQLSTILSNYYRRRHLPLGAILEDEEDSDSDDDLMNKLDEQDIDPSKKKGPKKSKLLAVVPEEGSIDEAVLD
jgi:hypothetical protein